MDILSTQFLSALVAIVIIDLSVLGDNAIVAGLAARSLPPDLQKRPCSGVPSGGGYPRAHDTSLWFGCSRSLV